MKTLNQTAVALGFFDGLHKGHMALINEMIAQAKEKNLTPVVIFFDNHPKKLLSKNPPETILQKHIKTEILQDLGAKIHHVSFKQIMGFSPEEFFQKVLIKELDAKMIACGKNYHFGKGASGNSETLRKLCVENSIDFINSELVKCDDIITSSTKIRELIKDGNIKKANHFLGREFVYEFEVFSGDKRGRTLGFPTINQYFDDGFIKPRFGVYVSRVFIGDEIYLGVTNIGIRPTVQTKKMRSETYIDGFSGDLYGQNIRVCLIDFLRDEKKFSSLDELERQIKQDLKNAKLAYSK